jgi:hypothetical protein
MSPIIKLNFQPRQVIKPLFFQLDTKPRDVLEQRFGLKPEQTSFKTLESIGQSYSITRERVRQIEEAALNRLRQNDLDRFDAVFNELKDKINSLGSVVQEKEFLNSVSSEPLTRNQIHFLMVLHDDFNNFKEDDEFHRRWATNLERADSVHEAIRRLHQELSLDDLFSEREIFSLFSSRLKNFLKENIEHGALFSLIKISRLIDSNHLGEWGLVSSCHIRPRGVRDLAYLIMRKHGSPMHFLETSKAIGETFSRPVNTQTVHNELIKDGRFVLVGRGLYALREWGYKSGVVRDVIRDILLSSGPMSKEEIIKTVLKERYVRENTVLINLQNGKYFKRNPDGTYAAIG